MGHRQPRTYPLFGFLLANFLTNAVLAKLAPISGVDFAYHSNPWLWYGKPTYGEYHQEQYPSYWKPVLSPPTYAPPPLYTTPSITTAKPELSQQQIININRLPYEYNDDYYGGTNTETEQEYYTAATNYETGYNVNNFYKHNDYNGTNIEPIALASNFNYRRQKPNSSYGKRTSNYPKYSTKRGPVNRITSERYKRYKNSQKRKRYTTPTYYDDDDSYEEFTTIRNRPRKRPRPNPYSRRTTTELYYNDSEDIDEDYEEEEYYESTTRPYRRRKPTQNRIRRPPAYNNEEYNYDNAYEYNDREPLTETLTLRPRTSTRRAPTRQAPTLIPRQGTTETQTETDTTTISTTASTMAPNTTTSTTNSTGNSTLYGPGTGNNNISITYTPPGIDYQYPTFTGYGPSNGNENISITYGPPSRLDYGAPPYIPWYTQQTRTNDIVRRVHDIVGFDRDIFRRRLT